MRKTVSFDKEALEILKKVKGHMKAELGRSADYSDVIRYLFQKACAKDKELKDAMKGVERC